MKGYDHEWEGEWDDSAVELSGRINCESMDIIMNDPYYRRHFKMFGISPSMVREWESSVRDKGLVR